MQTVDRLIYIFVLNHSFILNQLTSTTCGLNSWIDCTSHMEAVDTSAESMRRSNLPPWRTRHKAEQTLVQQGHHLLFLLLLVSFYVPFRRIQCSLWYSSHMFFRSAEEWSEECVGVSSVIVCSASSDLQFPMRTHTRAHTHMRIQTLYLPRLIAVIKQEAAARSYESAGLFSTWAVHAGRNTPVFCTSRSQSEWGRR